MPGKRLQEEAQDSTRKRRRTRQEPGAQSSQPTHLASTLDFHGVWRELKAAGWTSKPPRGLDNRHRYVLPGCAATGREGHDFLLEEEAVLSHFVQHCNPLVMYDDKGLQHTMEADSSAAAVTGVAPLPCQVMVLVTAPPMVAWCMLPVVDVVVVLCADDGSLGVAEVIAPLL
ncbi:hypothetical protein PF001_g24272 [Phytophthora fragariae]|uniref:Uncharacterized protein n=1 Tax=Phytophthora fragariae TaxID=53985 RepID=A0A6A3HMT2_9STRA|nr:hypothetical protein PF011_g26565 [Phytophthora fragariae]KAE9185470.1 hypothetical protein PF004_g23352 [Phytophthora fragariae]KAE9280354.1 hypothetical protein PF001_g24272 [Phytophthora fragariae]